MSSASVRAGDLHAVLCDLCDGAAALDTLDQEHAVRDGESAGAVLHHRPADRHRTQAGDEVLGRKTVPSQHIQGECEGMTSVLLFPCDVSTIRMFVVFCVV